MRTIAGLRADKKLTQEDLAKELGRTTQTIRNWEKRQPELSGETIILLSKYFKVSSDELLGLK
ncbi:helix-turn-helix transcriptional regulator [Aerococcus urinae]|uniref:helix-turn-helix transcriptional regulator n=1 Tax=Aerococcus urinae TaxID=1376 RepID=UPI00254C2CFE|nr:helix-turn-helix transcriptional regulator [Aerococcus urinae]MDK6688286.1 helix-turn-helix transcriptional regulator [Aerococcus urinae]